ncbi:MAG: bifunctional nuclease family protein [Phycisphaerales bacterium JB043]
MPVQMELSRILIRELSDFQLIELHEIDGDRAFPIVIGLAEAQAIERRLKGIDIKRPQTHELMASIIEELGGELLSITIRDLNEHTFFATLDIRNSLDKVLHIDSRPSDAIALGVAGGVPIYVEEHVLDAAQSDDD